MGNRVIDRAYETVLEYAPEDVKRILSDQIPRIEQTIDDELGKFSEELSKYIQGEVDKLVREVEEGSKTWRSEINGRLDELSTATKADLGSLQMAVDNLRASLDEYENRWKSLGEKAQKAIVTAARSAGIPVPDLSKL